MGLNEEKLDVISFHGLHGNSLILEKYNPVLILPNTSEKENDFECGISSDPLLSGYY